MCSVIIPLDPKSIANIANISKSVTASSLVHCRWSLFIQLCPTVLGWELRTRIHPLSMLTLLQQLGAQTPGNTEGLGNRSWKNPPLPPLTQVCTLTELLFLSRLASCKIITSSGFEPWSSKSSKPFLSFANSLCVPGQVLGSEDTVDRIVQVSALWCFHSSWRRQVITHQTNE